MTDRDLTARLVALGLVATAAHLDDIVALATKPTKIDRPLVESVLRRDFIRAAHNVVLVPQQGFGKTMIAQNIVHQAALAGHGVLFITVAQLLLDLGAQESTRALERRLKY